MFGIGTSELFVLMIAALFILGPERLPSAAVWLARTIKQVREYATGAREQLKDELGPELDELRKPLAELQQLRGLKPRSVITKHLLDGDDSFLFAPKSVGAEVTETFDDIQGSTPAQLTKPSMNAPSPVPNTAAPAPAVREPPPFDPDAT